MLPLSQVMHGDEALAILISIKLTVLAVFLTELSNFLELFFFFSDYNLVGTLAIE